MIKAAFIAKQVEKSRHARRTSPFLRRLILSTVDQVALEWYGDDSAIRCLQISSAIQQLLNEVGIRSELWVGALCIPGIGVDAWESGWVGFWDEDHHAWASTEFGELVDLNASRVHLHPCTVRKYKFAMPALWWDELSDLPSVIRYLPDSHLAGLHFPDPGESADLEHFQEAVGERWRTRLETQSVEAIQFGPVLDGIQTLDRLVDEGHGWAVGAYQFNAAGYPLPPWIEARTDEMRDCIRQGIVPPSRLAQLSGSFASRGP